MDVPTYSPREIVSELDRFIVGQNDAKRAVAIALRNRWRRQQLPEEMRDEVVPKNILMIGPTGCGKTEIARRLEAMMAVADADRSFTLTGNGDVLEPEDGVIAIGSGGNYALAAARALVEVPGLTAEQVARRAMKIAADICVYTNYNVIVETIA